MSDHAPSAGPAGHSGMAERIRALNWAATPLGPIETWPQSLNTATGIMLSTRQPAGICWGVDLLCLYNDALAAAVWPEQHSAGLGRPAREAWPEDHPLLGPELTRVMAGGEPVWQANRLVPTRRHGRVELVCWTYSLGPIHDAGAPNGVGGVLMLTAETVGSADALRESEARVEAIFAHASVGLSEIGLDGRFLLVNDELCRLLGRSREDLLRSGVPDVTYPEDIPASLEVVARTLETGGPCSLDKRYQRPDGTLVWAHSRLTRLDAPEGGPATLLAVTADLTARREAEERLRESEARLAAVFESLPVGVGISDNKGELVLSNEEMRRFLPGQVLSSRDDARHGRWRAYHPEGRRIERTDYPGARALRGETVLPGTEMLYAGDDGREIWTHVAARPLLNDHGRLTGAVVVVTDINELKRSAEALRASAATLRQVADNIPALIGYHDRDLRYVWVNEGFARFFGVPRVAIIGRTVPEHVGERAFARLRPAMERALAGEAMHFEDCEPDRFDRGEHGWTEEHYVPRFGLDGVVEGFYVLALDITERKRAQEALQKSERSLREKEARLRVVLAELQHRTRNLLGVVRSVGSKTLGEGEAVNEFNARLSAIGQVQGFLARSGAWSASLRELIEAELAAAGGGAAGQLTVAGPEVRLLGKTVEPVALALHELATNALKYGALSEPSGRLSVTWRLEEAAEDRRLVLEWVESGVVMREGAQPARRGYGRELIEQALPYQLGAETCFQLGPDGVRCLVVLPISASAGDTHP